MSRQNGSQTGLFGLGIPNGWFAVAWSKDLVDGEVKRARYFGQEIVMFRTRAGAVHVLDAYSAHLGAHLGEGGRVVGETLRCPFHGWRYDGGGRCVDIPYYTEGTPPAAAKVRSWPVVEQNRMVFVWHHAEGLPPSWDVPVMPELGDLTTLSQQALLLSVAVVLPVVGAAAIVGLLVSVVQAATQVQDHTIGHLPRLLAVVAVLMASGPWIGGQIAEFAVRAFAGG